MIIKCKKIISYTTGEELENSPWLTQEKEYVVLALRITLRDGVMVVLHSDLENEPVLKRLEGFEVISQKTPKNWVVMVDKHYYFFLPESWAYPEFFEEIENEKPKAVELFKKEAQIIYEQEGLPYIC